MGYFKPSPIRAERITMKINMNETLYVGCVFLGGTCADSTWRKELIEMLHDNVPYFNPQVAEWTEADAAREDACKPVARFNVFVITGDALGTYSGWEIHEEAMRGASRLIFCTIGKLPANQVGGIGKIRKRLTDMGATVCDNLEEIAVILNEAYAK